MEVVVGEIPIWKTKGPRLWLLTRHKLPFPGTLFMVTAIFSFIEAHSKQIGNCKFFVIQCPDYN